MLYGIVVDSLRDRKQSSLGVGGSFNGYAFNLSNDDVLAFPTSRKFKKREERLKSPLENGSSSVLERAATSLFQSAHVSSLNKRGRKWNWKGARETRGKLLVLVMKRIHVSPRVSPESYSLN